MNKFIKYICLTFIISISVFYAGMNNTKAMGTPDGNGNAKCIYSCNHSQGGNNTREIQYVIGINVFRNTEGNYDGYAVVNVGNWNLFNSDVGSTSNATFDNKNYVSLFNDSDKLKNKFYLNNSWSCPEISGGYSGGHNSFKIYFDKYNGSTKDRCITKDMSTQENYNELKDDDATQSTNNNGSTNVGNDPDYNEKADTSKIAEANTSCYQVNTGDQPNYYRFDSTKKEMVEISKETFDQECISYETTNCNIFDENILRFLNKLFWIISIAGIILLVVMTMVEFVKALTGSDDSGLIKGFKHTLVRIVAVIILLLLPTIITFILNLVNRYSDYTIGDEGNVICGVGEK